MENIGESQNRNIEFNKKFNRNNLIKSLVSVEKPVIFDVGAHWGESIDYFKALFSASMIYSFEPDPESFDLLTKRDYTDVNYFNLALSSKIGELSFFRNEISHTNSLFKVNLESKDSIGITKAKNSGNVDFFNNFNSEVKVKTSTLDEICKNNSIHLIDLLKIDVQGAECEVLKGGKNIMRNTKVLIIEISFFDYYENHTTFLDVETILSPLNFSLFSISEISNNPMNGRTDWVEAIYINKDFQIK